MCAYVLNARAESSRPEASCVASQLELVEARLAGTVASDVHTASDVAFHLLEAGGKRIRPLLVLLSAGACGGDVNSAAVIDIAAAAELVHTASLVHDDVVDETSERRGVTTANGKWGNKISVLGGDFLLAKAFTLLADISQSEVTEVLSATAVQMTESEVLQAESEGSFDSWRACYWRIIRGKTAAFMSGCCECGAILAEAAPSVRDAVREFGAHFGLAFQITDDLLDILGDPTETGKDIGSDLMHGKFTLPVMLAVQNASGGDRARLLSLLEREALSCEEARCVAQVIVDCGAAELARNMALDFVGKARACLASIPPSEYTLALASLAASTANREV